MIFLSLVMKYLQKDDSFLGFRPIASEEELLREYSVSEQASSLPYTLLGGVVFDEGMLHYILQLYRSPSLDCTKRGLVSSQF